MTRAKLNKLIKIDKQHAEVMYNIALEKLRREQEKHARKAKK